jgi:N-acetylmuramoyl-L-alanine amidase
VGNQEMVALDDLAGAFQLNVRDDGGAITVAYKGRTIVLTPDQTIASVAGRLISLPAPPVRAGSRWFVPLDFVSRALAPIYDLRLDLRRSSHLLVAGDLRVPRVTIRHEPLAASARLTIDTVPSTTPAVTEQGNQRLLVRFDVDALDVTIPVFQPTGFIQAVRILDATTLAIDLGQRFASYRATSTPLDNGTRLVVEVVGAQTEVTPPQSAPIEPPPAAFGPPGVRTIAIDAGHGGADAGARGPGGAAEKDVTLAIARRLRSAIETRLGLRVVMTRDEDRAVPLSDRTALANNNKADVFVTLHANGSFRPERSGATVGVAGFDQASMDREGVAPQRLPVAGGGTRDIEMLPWNLAQIQFRDKSERLAQILWTALSGRVSLAPNPIEHAPFRILESANMPAVLLEVGYMTNADEEKALTNGEAQNTIAQAVADAITRYRELTAPTADETPR